MKTQRLIAVTLALAGLVATPNLRAEEAGDARVFGGIHFRKACTDANAMGRQEARYILQNAFQRLHGNAPSSDQ